MAKKGEIQRPKHIKEIMDLSSLALSGTALSTLLDLDDIHHLALTVEVTYHASATAGITFDIQTSPDNRDWDTDALTSFSPSFTAGATVRKTVYIDPDAKNMRVKVTNSDSSYAATNVRIRATLTKEEVGMQYHETSD